MAKKRPKRASRERLASNMGGNGLYCINVPDGVSVYKPKGGTRVIEIIPYIAGDGNPNANKGEE